MTVGTELAHTRERLGLSLEDISARTKISVERLGAIERMEAEQLPAILYLKGFVRAYAAELGLDPEDFSHRYLTELDGDITDELDEFESENVNPPAVARDTGVSTIVTAKGETSPTRIHVEQERPNSAEQTTRSMPRSLLLLAIVALLAGVGGAAIFDQYSRPPAGAGARAVAEQPARDDVAKADERQAEQTPRDADRAVHGETVPSPAASADPVAARHEDAASPDLSGTWTLTNRVDSTDYKPFRNLTLGFQLQLQQQGNSVTGTGVKVMENGKTLAARAKVPISVEGTLSSRRLQLTFTERGTRRASKGTLTLDVADEGTLRGTFASDASNARGTSVAQRAR